LKGNAGIKVTVTLSPYIYSQLEKLVQEKGIKRTAIVSLAIEKYAREEERNEQK